MAYDSVSELKRDYFYGGDSTTEFIGMAYGCKWGSKFKSDTHLLNYFFNTFL